MDEAFGGELCSWAGCCVYGADTALALVLPGQTDPAWPKVMIWVNAAGGEICRKQSGMNTDREPGGLIFKI